MSKLRRPQIVAAMVAVLVLATIAVAMAAAGRGGEEGFQAGSVEPSPAGTSESPAADEAPASTVDPLPEPPAPAGVPATGAPAGPPGPDTPVSSGDSSRPDPVVVGDPPAAFPGIRTFEDCAAAGYPVAESYPEQCRTPDGRLFVRTID